MCDGNLAMANQHEQSYDGHVEPIIQQKMNTIEDYLHGEILAILTESSAGVDDGFGGLNTGVFDDSFDEVATDIIKMLKSSFVVKDVTKPKMKQP